MLYVINKTINLNNDDNFKNNFIIINLVIKSNFLLNLICIATFT